MCKIKYVPLYHWTRVLFHFTLCLYQRVTCTITTNTTPDSTKSTDLSETDVCTNPFMIRDMQGDTKCSYYEKVMDKTPLVAAIFDTAEDLHICGRGYCSLRTQHYQFLPQILATLAIFAVILLWASGIQFRRNRQHHQQQWSLPIRTPEE